MRFLFVVPAGTLNLTEALTTPPEPYAIPFPTWAGDQEVSLDDIKDKTGQNKARYTQLRFSANQAKIDDLQYCCVDTCCINKVIISVQP